MELTGPCSSGRKEEGGEQWAWVPHAPDVPGSRSSCCGPISPSVFHPTSKGLADRVICSLSSTPTHLASPSALTLLRYEEKPPQ